ncbi:hypothetical protein [Methanovulcanius yangii]|uniref:hypothetical protein n=1 Tax=Methanovulcanius yangii TaxID=1789227 RepID=UPI0029CA7E8A|nr:hypothetical protein [Methanovulcanius yangii]
MDPDYVDGNPKCCDLDSCYEAYKIEDGPYAGTHYIDGGSITITMVNATHFNFETDGICVYAVIVKGRDANVYNYYDYDGPITSDTILGPPLNPSSGKYPDISHIDFCYACCPPTPTPPPTTPTPVPEFPFYMPAMMALFALVMGAVVVSLGKYR